MENLDVIILSSVAAIGFVVFIVACFKEFSKMEKEGYVHDTNQKRFGRDAIYDVMERLFDDKSATKEDRTKLLKTLDRTIADMEYNGVYFPEEVKQKLQQEKVDLFCEYSGLPSVKAYEET